MDLQPELSDHNVICSNEQAAAVWSTIKTNVQNHAFESAVTVKDIESAYLEPPEESQAVRKFRRNQFLTDQAQKLGEGGSGDVYLVKHKQFRHAVVLKQFTSTKYPHFIFSECQILKTVQHKQIVKLFGWFFESKPFLVLQACAGSLVCFSEYITNRDKLRAYIQTMEGLTFIHSNDIIHCDIKPDNILVTDSGNFLITDFGEAVDLKGLPFVEKPERPGTTNYFSLSILQDARYSKSSDLWAMGCTIYNMEMHDFLVRCEEDEEESTEGLLKCIQEGLRRNSQSSEDEAQLQTFKERIDACKYRLLIHDLLFKKDMQAKDFRKHSYITHMMKISGVTDQNLQSCPVKFKLKTNPVTTVDVFPHIKYKPKHAIFAKFYYESEVVTREMVADGNQHQADGNIV